jgi:hypothetical protein
MNEREDGQVYTQWSTHNFTVDRNIETRFSFLLANFSHGNEITMRSLIDICDRARREFLSVTDFRRCNSIDLVLTLYRLAMPLLKPNPSIFYRATLGPMAFLPLAVGAVTGGLVSTLATPLAAAFGAVDRRLGSRRDCVVAYDGIEILAPLMAPIGENLGIHQSHLEFQSHIKPNHTTLYKVKFDVIRI